MPDQAQDRAPAIEPRQHRAAADRGAGAEQHLVDVRRNVLRPDSGFVPCFDGADVIADRLIGPGAGERDGDGLWGPHQRDAVHPTRGMDIERDERDRRRDEEADDEELEPPAGLILLVEFLIVASHWSIRRANRR